MENTTRCNLRRCLAASVDGTILAALFVSTGLLYFTGDTLARTGFFCNDTSIARPYTGQTVEGTHLLAFCIFLPLLTAAAVEGCIPAAEGGDGSGARKLWAKFLSFSQLAALHLFCFAVTLALTAVGKRTVGRLRPNFFALCKPVFDRSQCENEGLPALVTDYTCEGKEFHGSERWTRESRLSFPSGHAALSCQAAAFIFLYIRARARALRQMIPGNLLVMLFQFLVVAFALFSSLSRIKDNMHFLSDVLVGGALGVFVQVHCFDMVGGLFKESNDSLQPSISATKVSNCSRDKMQSEPDTTTEGDGVSLSTQAEVA